MEPCVGVHAPCGVCFRFSFPHPLLLKISLSLSKINLKILKRNLTSPRLRDNDGRMSSILAALQQERVSLCLDSISSPIPPPKKFLQTSCDRLSLEWFPFGGLSTLQCAFVRICSKADPTPQSEVNQEIQHFQQTLCNDAMMPICVPGTSLLLQDFPQG